jgi:hypothetical protein
MKLKNDNMPYKKNTPLPTRAKAFETWEAAKIEDVSLADDIRIGNNWADDFCRDLLKM